MMAVEGETRQWGTRCDRTGMCREWELGEQEGVVRGQPEVGTAGWAGPDCSGLAGFGLAQHGFLCDVNLLVDHHPAVVRRVARSART